MNDKKHTEFGTTEQEIFEELKIRNELEPISSFDGYLSNIDEIISEKMSFGELNDEDDIEVIKDGLARRFDELAADSAGVIGEGDEEINEL